MPKAVFRDSPISEVLCMMAPKMLFNDKPPLKASIPSARYSPAVFMRSL